MAASGFEYIQKWHAARSEKGWWHSFELPDGSRIEGIASLESLRQRLGQFPIADDLRGKRVLDIGCWDGWFSFEMERRGAEVMAIDCWDNPRFRQMHAAYRSKVDYRLIDMYELTPARIGRFDVVLFMGVLYHLKHPLLALERVRVDHGPGGGGFVHSARRAAGARRLAAAHPGVLRNRRNGGAD